LIYSFSFNILSQASGLPQDLITGFGISASAAILFYDTYKIWEEKQKNIERNGLYFHYQACRKLQI